MTLGSGAQEPTTTSFEASDAAPSLSLQAERERRWRLILGKASEAAPESGEGAEGQEPSDGAESGADQGEGAPRVGPLSDEDQAIDELLESMYGEGNEGGAGKASPELARHLGDIRRYFSAPVAQMMQRDALHRLNLRKLLNDPELLAEIEPDIDLVSRILSLSKVMPEKTRETARRLVRKVVEELQEKLEYPLRQALHGSLNRALRARRPRHREINWQRTIHANLKHYQVDKRTVIPETLIGYGKQRNSLRDVILCIDQSASMGRSVVYASIFGAVMATAPSLSTRLVAFSTTVVDLTGELQDPVDLLFGIQLRGGTNIGRALAYCRQQITRPRQTILVLISDLFEGGNRDLLNRHVAALVDDGVQLIVLLALDDQGTPRFNRQIAQNLVELGVPSFACTPELFPDLMGAVINGQDIQQWAGRHDIVTAPHN